MSVKVSVILPSLNVESYIRECMDSVTGQTLKDIEIICIDAGSTDGTCKILKEFEEKDNRVVLLHSEIKSYGAQVNMGINYAKGKYVAIVESDDFIAAEMYEELYCIAEENQLDFVKANWDSFVEIGGYRLFTRERSFPEGDKIYGRVLSAKTNPEVYLRDITVWRGIYNREFLIKNKLFFNESPGAAYQDYGFTPLVLSYAERIMYVDLSFYRYRYGREGASSWNKNVLKYTYQEWSRLLVNRMLPSDVDWKYVYWRMSAAFIGECDKVLEMQDYKTDTEFFMPYYLWFKERIKKIMDDHLFSLADDAPELWFMLRLLLDSPQSYADVLRMKGIIYQEGIDAFINKIGRNRDAVIFGCGYYGCMAYDILERNKICVEHFCDNNSVLWGEKLAGITILSPSQCINEGSNSVFVVSNKKFGLEIKEQLLELGIRPDNIIMFHDYVRSGYKKRHD